jgi:hypothetical protein
MPGHSGVHIMCFGAGEFVPRNQPSAFHVSPVANQLTLRSEHTPGRTMDRSPPNVQSLAGFSSGGASARSPLTGGRQITRNRASYSCHTCRRRKVKCDKVWMDLAFRREVLSLTRFSYFRYTRSAGTARRPGQNACTMCRRKSGRMIGRVHLEADKE